MESAYCDDRAFPLVVVTFPERSSLEEITQLFAELESVLRGRRARCGVLVDLTLLNPLTASAIQRRAVADEGQRLRPLFEEFVAAEVRVIPNATVRGIVTALDWIEGSVPWRRTNVPTPAAGMAWLRENLSNPA